MVVTVQGPYRKKDREMEKKIIELGPLKPVPPPGSFSVSGFNIPILKGARFEYELPRGSQIISAVGTAESNIRVFYKYAVPAKPLKTFFVVVLKDGEMLNAASIHHKYIPIASVPVGGVVYHLFNYYLESSLVSLD